MKKILGALLLSAAVAVPAAAEMKGGDFKVVGSWAGNNNFSQREKPFWEEILAQKSSGAIDAQITPMDELGLKGFELGRFLKQGLFDFVHADFSYTSGDNPVFEGVDIAGVAQSVDEARRNAIAYRPALEPAVQKTFGAKVLMQYGDPTQVLWCGTPIKSIDDLKGKKVRVFSKGLGDLIEALGGEPVSVSFAEVVPALQRGVIDCAVTGTISGYLAKWPEVASHLFVLRAASGASWYLGVSEKRWAKLDEETRNLISDEATKLEERMWAATAKEDQAGIDCATGGQCPYGEPANMTLVEPSAEDIAKLRAAMEATVLPRWAERCGTDCANTWNDTVGKEAGLTIKVN